MPLDYSKTHKAFVNNLKRELKSGKPKAQALAIAYSVMRGQSKKPKTRKEYVKEVTERCWKGYKPVPGKKAYSPGSCKKEYAASTRSDKKFMVKVDGKVIHFGDPNMTIKKKNPERKKSFCARHNCASKSNRKTAGYWSCRSWNCKTGGSK